ncbi:hypothetical protein DFS34DRAFT_635439 [Phlyctochytrium arcticum]|nr:hypothetical protein DFS34DRAFT_635439 [Phlyctochytrium arcticum]
MATEDQLKSDMKENRPASCAGRSDLGVGDLVFSNWDRNKFLVVEVKARHEGTGPTARAARTRARKKVGQQLERHMKTWARKHPEAEVYGQTNFGGELGEIIGPYLVESASPKYGGVLLAAAWVWWYGGQEPEEDNDDNGRRRVGGPPTTAQSWWATDHKTMASEDELKLDMRMNPPPNFPKFITDEWEVVPGRSDLGVSALVFGSWDWDRHRVKLLVVEVKARNNRTGRTASAARTGARKKVGDQLHVYMEAWTRIHPEADVYGQTNFGGELGEIIGPIWL